MSERNRRTSSKMIHIIVFNVINVHNIEMFHICWCNFRATHTSPSKNDKMYHKYGEKKCNGMCLQIFEQ